MNTAINDPAILAEVNAVFDVYEAALASNDIGVLDRLFWNSPHTLRYGIGENLYGADEIAAFRIARPGGSPPRQVLRRVVTTYGRDCATTNIEFKREGPSAKIGRQSQTWLRTEDGWKVVTAHVSFMAETS